MVLGMVVFLSNGVLCPEDEYGPPDPTGNTEKSNREDQMT